MTLVLSFGRLLFFENSIVKLFSEIVEFGLRKRIMLCDFNRLHVHTSIADTQWTTTGQVVDEIPDRFG